MKFYVLVAQRSGPKVRKIEANNLVEAKHKAKTWWRRPLWVFSEEDYKTFINTCLDVKNRS